MAPPVVLVDSHAHLDMEEFASDRKAVIQRAFGAGVRSILCPIDVSNGPSAATILALTEAHPAVWAAAGLHPHQAKLGSPDMLDAVRRLAARGHLRAVGEIGLDYHYDFSSPEDQRRVFRDQLALARELRLPTIIHSRLAGRDILQAVRDAGAGWGGVLHCFTEDWDFAKAMIDIGFAVSFSGIITFPKSQALRDVAAKVPLDRILIETDAPYLAPVPHRGTRNEPAYVIETAKRLAEINSIPLDALAEAIVRNFHRVFGIPAPDVR